jgi:ABC-type cobalamin/Fe3+-siderophores transport system ATPase subunit
MDLPGQRAVFQALATLARERGATIVIITHALAAAAQYADHALFLDRDHAMVIAGSVAEVSAHPEFRAHFGSAEAVHG